MKEPAWVTTEIILAIQEDLLTRFGGLAGLRDAGRLESALKRPQKAFQYSAPSVFELAATYAAGIIRNHPCLVSRSAPEHPQGKIPWWV